MKLSFLVGVVILTVIFMPFVCIWSINTLFALEIPFTFWTWVAASILLYTFSSGVPTFKFRGE